MAQALLNKLNSWIVTKTGGDPYKIKNGYHLNGDALFPESNENPTAFVAPFAVGAMVNKNNRKWLNSLWTRLLRHDFFDSDAYYGSSIKLLCMITVSVNWWSPAVK